MLAMRRKHIRSQETAHHRDNKLLSAAGQRAAASTPPTLAVGGGRSASPRAQRRYRQERQIITAVGDYRCSPPGWPSAGSNHLPWPSLISGKGHHLVDKRNAKSARLWGRSADRRNIFRRRGGARRAAPSTRRCTPRRETAIRDLIVSQRSAGLSIAAALVRCRRMRGAAWRCNHTPLATHSSIGS